MNREKFNDAKKAILALAQDIMNKKQPEYTNKNDDVLLNFKSSAEKLGLEPQEVWAVFFHKHVQAILTHAHNPEMNEAEPIESRYADAINYLFLGWALHIEKLLQEHENLDINYKTIE